MKPIDQPKDLQAYYKDQGVVDRYMHRRTTQPLNGLLHRRQVAFLNQVLSQRAPAAVLEIACGPGRVTTATRGVKLGVAVDASPAMLATAKQRIQGTPGDWNFLRTDAFVLPFRDGSFDLAYTFRFIRHFQLADRQRLYRELHRVLRPHGTFIVDALNYDVVHPARLRKGLQHYPIYDVLYRPGELAEELRGEGFRIVAQEGILKRFPLQQRLNRLRRFRLGALASVLIDSLEKLPGDQVNTWVVVAEKL